MKIRKQNGLADDELSLEEAIFAFRHKLKDLLRQEAENLKCPVSQMDTLTFIAEEGTPSMKEIARYLKITPPSATAIVETMQKNKLITRVLSKKDRRTIRVALTSKAWKLFKILHKRKLAVITKMFSRLGNTERKQFIKIITILTKE